jgi:hypothetical protein
MSSDISTLRFKLQCCHKNDTGTLYKNVYEVTECVLKLAEE